MNNFTAPVYTGAGTNFMTSTHQQDSGRKSSADGARNEDIRAKLARYKQERENFEQVRQQFRQKHKEIEQRDKQ